MSPTISAVPDAAISPRGGKRGKQRNLLAGLRGADKMLEVRM